MEEGIKLETGELLLPESQYNPVADPVNGATYIPDDQYEKVKGGEPWVPSVPKEETPETNTGDNADLNRNESAPQETRPEFNLDEIVKEKTGGKFEKWEEFFAKATEEKSEPQQIDLPEQSKKIIEALKEGKEDELVDVLMMRKTLSSVDKMSAEEVIKLKMQIENPDFTPEDIEDEFQDRFGLTADRDLMDESEYAKLERRHNRKLESQAKQDREALAKLKEEIKLPDFSVQQQQSVDPEAQKFIDETNRFAEEFSNDLKNNLGSFKTLDLSISDEDVQFTHQFSIDDNEKADLATKAGDFWLYIQSRYAKDGKFDTRKLLEDIYFNENRSKVIKSAVTRAINQGKVAVVKGVANVTDTRTPSPATDPAAEKAQADFKRFYLG